MEFLCKNDFLSLRGMDTFSGEANLSKLFFPVNVNGVSFKNEFFSIMLSTLGKNFSRWHFEIHMHIFSRKKALTFHANFLHTFHVKSLFLRQFA